MAVRCGKVLFDVAAAQESLDHRASKSFGVVAAKFVRGAPAAEHIIESLKNLGGVGLPEGKKLHGASETINTDQNVAAAVRVWFTESHNVKGV
jgi:hypothetical protein